MTDDQVSEEVVELARHADEVGRWDYIHARIAKETDNEVDEKLRTEALAALTVLQNELGPSWPREAYARDEDLGAFIGNRAAWTLRQLVEHAAQIAQMRNDPGWQTIARRLRQPNQSSAALFEMRIARLAHQRGLHCAFDPPTSGAKRGDVLITPSPSVQEPRVYVECTEVQAVPDVVRATDRMRFRIWPLDLDVSLRVGGLLARPVDDGELDRLARRAHQFYEQVKLSGAPAEVAIEGLLSLWAVPRDHPDADEFMARRGDTKTINFSHDPFLRLLGALRKKQRQLPASSASVIAFRPSRLMTQQPSPRIRAAIREEISAEPRVSAVVIFVRHWAPGATPRSQQLDHEDHLALIDLYDPVKEITILVWNPRRQHRTADDVIRQLLVPRLEPWIDI